jgi:hypothetical protein
VDVDEEGKFKVLSFIWRDKKFMKNIRLPGVWAINQNQASQI